MVGSATLGLWLLQTPSHARESASGPSSSQAFACPDRFRARCHRTHRVARELRAYRRLDRRSRLLLWDPRSLLRVADMPLRVTQRPPPASTESTEHPGLFREAPHLYRPGLCRVASSDGSLGQLRASDEWGRHRWCCRPARGRMRRRDADSPEGQREQCVSASRNHRSARWWFAQCGCRGTGSHVMRMMRTGRR